MYLNHRDALRQQLARAPRPFPKLRIKPKPKPKAAAGAGAGAAAGAEPASSPITDIDGFCFDDFEVVGYEPHGALKMKMAV